jgi:hypothetical protein
MAKTQTEAGKRDWSALAGRLGGVPESSRKLLAHIIELAYAANRLSRQPDTAYLPELHESCGLDVEAMYETLQPLQGAGLIEMENQYPFEDVRLSDPEENSWPEILRRCQSKNIPLRDVIVDLRFDRLQ